MPRTILQRKNKCGYPYIMIIKLHNNIIKAFHFISNYIMMKAESIYLSDWSDLVKV